MAPTGGRGPIAGSRNTWRRANRPDSSWHPTGHERTTRSDHSEMAMIGARIHPALRSLVSRIIGYRDFPPRESVHFGQPSPAATVIIAFNEPLDVGWVPDPGSHDAAMRDVARAGERFGVLVAGLHTRPSLIRTHGVQHGIQLSLTPAGVRTFFRAPIGAFSNSLAEVTEVPGGWASLRMSALRARLEEVPDWSARFEVLQMELLRAASDEEHAKGDGARQRVHPAADEAWRQLLRTRGKIGITELAEHLGVGRRTLLTKFRTEYGLSPKEAQRIVRFATAKRLITSGMLLAEAAAASGYSDQAHLSREWVRLAGQPPRQSFRAVYPNLQDGRSDRAAD